MPSERNRTGLIPAEGGASVSRVAPSGKWNAATLAALASNRTVTWLGELTWPEATSASIVCRRGRAGPGASGLSWSAQQIRPTGKTADGPGAGLARGGVQPTGADPVGEDADQRLPATGAVDGFGATLDHDGPRSPWVHRGQVVDHD